VLPLQCAASPQPFSAGEPPQDLLPVFDETCLRDLFLPGDPEVGVWIADYLSSAAQVERDLAKWLALADLTSADREAIAAAAHQLAGSSLSIGAVQLGTEAKSLEAASEAGSPDVLVVRFAALRHELAVAREAIDAFAVGFFEVRTV
jgi:HPt (histidine-containing phosphotransfer) domain-containing protein